MTKEDVIRMAREAGYASDTGSLVAAYEFFSLERFAALVAACEREECAKVAEAADDWHPQEVIAAAIRARGQK